MNVYIRTNLCHHRQIDQYQGSFEDLPSQNLSIYYNQILNANFSTFYLLGFFQHKKQSLLIESCHLYAYIINPMRKKKNVQLFWVCFGVWRGRDIFYFLFQFLCIDFSQ